MKVEVTREELKRIVNNAASVVDKKSTIPVLANVLFEAEDGRITLSATDLEVCYTTQINADITEPGRCLAPVHPLSKLLAALTTETVIIEAQKDSVVISSKGQFSFPAMDPDDYPAFALPESTTNDMVPIDAESFLTPISSVLHATARKENYHGIPGVLIKKVDDQLHVVASDGTRLSMRKIDADIPLRGSFVMSRKSVSVVKKINKSSSVLLFKQTDDGIVLKNEYEDTVLIRPVQLSYPDYVRILEAEEIAVFETDTKAFVKMIKRLCLASDTQPYVNICIDSGVLKGHARSDLLEVSEEIPVSTSSGDFSAW